MLNELIEKQLRERFKAVENEMKETGNNKDYVELRCITIKIKNIIKKYKKDLTKTEKTDIIKLMKGSS